jgi:hypothetical protein
MFSFNLHTGSKEFLLNRLRFNLGIDTAKSLVHLDILHLAKKRKPLLKEVHVEILTNFIAQFELISKNFDGVELNKPYPKVLLGQEVIEKLNLI